MKPFYRNQKGSADLIVVAVIFVGLIASVYLVVKPVMFSSNASRPTNAVPTVVSLPTTVPNDMTSQVPAINNKADLLNTLKEVENTNVDEVSTMLFQNDKDVNSF
jgi:hypothetical protein